MCESSYISFLNHTSCALKLDQVKIESCDGQTQNSIAQLAEPYKSSLKSEESLYKFNDSNYVKLEDDHHNDLDYDDEPKYSPLSDVANVKDELESVCKEKHSKKG